jgi:xanthine/uracil permease
VCSIFFASGLNTLLQTTWGDRLPIVQGGSFSFITPAFAIIANVAQRDARFKVRMKPLAFHTDGAATRIDNSSVAALAAHMCVYRSA